MKIDPSAYDKLTAVLKLTRVELDALTDDEWAQITKKIDWVEGCIVDDKLVWVAAAGYNRGNNLNQLETELDDLPLISQRILTGGGLLPTAVPTVSDSETPSELLVTGVTEIEREETFHDHYQPKDRVPLPGGIESLAIDYQPNSNKPAETVTVVEQKTKTKRPYNKTKKV